VPEYMCFQRDVNVPGRDDERDASASGWQDCCALDKLC